MKELNSLEKAGLHAILQRCNAAKLSYSASNRKGIDETSADTHWGDAENSLDDAISLLEIAIQYPITRPFR